MKRNDYTGRIYYLPFQIIKAAVSGNPSAIMKVLQNFDGFMTYMSKRKYRIYGEGEIYLPDPELNDELIIRLIEAVMKFKL